MVPPNLTFAAVLGASSSRPLPTVPTQMLVDCRAPSLSRGMICRPGSAASDRSAVAAAAEQLAGTPATPASTVGEDLSEVAALLNGLAPRRSSS